MASDSETTILVIDRREHRALVRRLVDGEHRVLEADDGETGLAMATTFRVDCILLDITPQGPGGFEVLERLARDPRTREIPVIVVTAADERFAATERAFRAGAVDYLTEPIDARRVTPRLRSAIERGRRLKQAGHDTIERNAVDVLHLVADVVEAFQPAARKGSIDLAVHAADVPDTVLGDAARLEQVVMSLVSNALRFTPAGGSIRLEVGGDETAVMVGVRDSGPGVPPAQRLQLFSERKAGMPGTGLAICRRVLEAHGGRIWLEDTAAGAAVVFRLPASS